MPTRKAIESAIPDGGLSIVADRGQGGVAHSELGRYWEVFVHLVRRDRR